MQVMDFDENFRTMVTKEKVFKTDEFKPALDKILDEKKFLRVMDFDENFRTMVTKEKVFKTAEFKPALDKILQEYDYKGQWEEYCKV